MADRLILKDRIFKGKEIWNTWISEKKLAGNDYICIALDDEIELYEMAEPYFLFLKERKNLRNIYVVTDYREIHKFENNGVTDILKVSKADMDCLISYFKIITNFTNISILTCKDEFGCGLESLFHNGKASKTEYVKMILLDLGGIL